MAVGQANGFDLSQTRHEFEVIRLWEVETEALLQAPGLWPFAVLSQTENREVVLIEVAHRLEGLTDRREQSNLAASTAILAGLVLDKRLIQRILTEDIMRESVIIGSISGYPTGVDNQSIDGDLAREYASKHGED